MGIFIHKIFPRLLLAIGFCMTLVVCSISVVSAAEDHGYEMLEEKALGQEVSFNAWGGSPAINNYIQWVARQVDERYGIRLKHIKLTNTSQAVSRILAEKVAGRTENGSVDLLWVNGENFSRMINAGLLQKDSWAFELPSFRYVNSEKMPDIISDFGVSTNGLESPWGRGQFVFGYDSQIVDTVPNSANKLANWIKNNPGKFAYPQPPDFTGTSFLKQVLFELIEDQMALYQNTNQVNASELLAPLWQWLDDLHPYLWRSGKIFPSNYSHLVRLLGDKEIAFAMAFNPAEFALGVEQGILPATIKSFIFDKGALSNVHFVAIPFNADAPEAAKITANFLLSPEAQLYKANIKMWGDPTVLDLDLLPDEWRREFSSLPQHPSMVSVEQLQKIIPEPHPSWVKLIEEEWQKRYAAGG